MAPSGNLQDSSSIDFEFFRIIFKTTLEKNMLRLPKKFLRQHGEDLSSSVFLILPSGTKWKLGLKKEDGKVWLQQGWPEFVKHYALGFGHFLYFSYKGNSKFEISICDLSTCGIQEPDANGPKRVETEEDDDDDTVQIFDNSDGGDSFHILDSSSAEDEEESLSPSSPPLKLTRTSHRGKCEKPTSGETSTTQGRKNPNVRGQCNHRGFRNSKAYEAASKFLSKRPFFKAIVTRSYNVRVPGSFVTRHIEPKAQTVSLQVGARSWPVNFLSCKTGYFLCGGYLKFLMGNSVSLGDVCIYELIEKKYQGNVVLKVHIFPYDNH